MARPWATPGPQRCPQDRRLIHDMSKKIEIDPMITHTMPLGKINDAFDLKHEGKSIRSVAGYDPRNYPNHHRSKSNRPSTS
jgi:hypothetical protein